MMFSTLDIMSIMLPFYPNSLKGRKPISTRLPSGPGVKRGDFNNSEK